MKVTFIRKPSWENIIPQDEFVIEKEIIVDISTFEEFTAMPLNDYNFIEENKDLMYCDLDDITHCILVKCNEKDYGFLINSEGTSYGRYVAHIPLKLL